MKDSDPTGQFAGTRSAGLKPHGAWIVNGVHVADTLQCVHCGAHLVHKKGSGGKLGYCLTCKGPKCGKKRCQTECMHYMKRMELNELRVLDDKGFIIEP